MGRAVSVVEMLSGTSFAEVLTLGPNPIDILHIEPQRSNTAPIAFCGFERPRENERSAALHLDDSPNGCLLARPRRLAAPTLPPAALLAPRRHLRNSRTFLPAERDSQFPVIHLLTPAQISISVQKQPKSESQRFRKQRPRPASSRSNPATRPDI